MTWDPLPSNIVNRHFSAISRQFLIERQLALAAARPTDEMTGRRFLAAGATLVRCEDPDAEKPVWTEPVYIGFGASLNKPTVRKNGEWILPVSPWERWHIDIVSVRFKMAAIDAMNAKDRK